MGSFGSGTGRVLYLVVCAAPPARRAGEVVRTMQGAGWDVCVVLTPSAAAWVDREALAAASGHRVRSEFRAPDEVTFEPFGDAVLVAPASFNTINKAAAGINDSLALGLVNEAIGSRVPVTLVPCVGGALAGHPAYGRSIELLRAAGVTVVVPHGGEDGGDDAAFLRAIPGTAGAPQTGPGSG